MLEHILIALIGGLPPTIVALTGLVLAVIQARRLRKNVQSVHKIVNQQRTDMMAEIDALKQVINDRAVADARRGVTSDPDLPGVGSV